MRLLFLSATVGLYMIISSYAVPTPDNSTKASSSPEPVTSTDTSSKNPDLVNSGIASSTTDTSTKASSENPDLVNSGIASPTPDTSTKASSENPDLVNSGIASPAPDTSTKASSGDAEKQSLLLIKDLVRRFKAKYMDKSFENSFMEDRAFSPFSAFFLLSLLSYRANGRMRKKYLEKIELFPRESKMAETGYRKFLEETAKNNLSMKTKIFVRSNSTLESDFVILSKDLFKAEIGLYDRIWDDWDKVRIQVNDWVQAQLNVSQLFQFLMMETETDMIVVNTIKLERAWKTPFDTSLTEQRPFYLLDSFNNKKNPVNVPTMHVSGRFRHGLLPELHTSFIELPFESKGDDDKMSMFILRPDDPAIVTSLSTNFAHLNLTRLLNSTEEQVDLSLPKFSFHQKHEAFLPETASDKKDRALLSELQLPPSPREFNTLAHEVVSVVVNETGHFADESTGVVDDLTFPHQTRRRRSNSEAPVKFVVNHPFIAIIATFIEESLNPLLVIKFLGRKFVPKDENPWIYVFSP